VPVASVCAWAIKSPFGGWSLLHFLTETVASATGPPPISTTVPLIPIDIGSAAGSAVGAMTDAALRAKGTGEAPCAQAAVHSEATQASIQHGVRTCEPCESMRIC